MTATTINPEEIEKFGKLAETWWDPNGKMKPLHRFNPVRLAYIREQVLRQFGRDGTRRHPFEGLKFLDIGCGGGLLCEPMSRLGAEVTGIDAAEKNISVAKIHAEQSGLDIDYRQLGPRALIVFRDCGAFAGASAGAVELGRDKTAPVQRPDASAQIGFKLCQHIVALHGGRLREEMEDGLRNFLIDLPTGAPHRNDAAQLDIAQAQHYARDLAALMARARKARPAS